MDFFCFFTSGFFFHVTDSGLRPSGLGFAEFFIVFGLESSLSMLIPCQWWIRLALNEHTSGVFFGNK